MGNTSSAISLGKSVRVPKQCRLQSRPVVAPWKSLIFASHTSSTSGGECIASASTLPLHLCKFLLMSSLLYCLLKPRHSVCAHLQAQDSQRFCLSCCEAYKDQPNLAGARFLGATKSPDVHHSVLRAPPLSTIIDVLDDSA